MNMFYDILLELSAFILGSLISLGMSWYFYKKTDYPSRVANRISDDILRMLIQDRIGVDFPAVVITPKAELPKNLDTPHITFFMLSSNTCKPGDSVVLLFQVKDEGLDFPLIYNTPDCLEITEVTSGISFPVKREGHGYYSSKVTFPADSGVGLHTILLKLHDHKDNQHTQSVKVEVVSE